MKATREDDSVSKLLSVLMKDWDSDWGVATDERIQGSPELIKEVRCLVHLCRLKDTSTGSEELVLLEDGLPWEAMILNYDVDILDTLYQVVWNPTEDECNKIGSTPGEFITKEEYRADPDKWVVLETQITVAVEYGSPHKIEMLTPEEYQLCWQNCELIDVSYFVVPNVNHKDRWRITR